MVQRFVNFINDKQLYKDNKNILLGVSGGIDSMVMAHLFLKSGFRFAIAHCNFMLRGEESDGDEMLVTQFAKKNKIQLFVKKINSRAYAHQNKISIQMAAREIHIEFFESLCQTHNFQGYATAHHQDDAIETFFINLIRGTGIAGLHGILPQQGLSLHPMLFTNREEIRHYANENKIVFRNDSSNAKTDYARNKIRHQLLPVLKSINPAFDKVMNGNLDRLHRTEQIYQQKINEYLTDLVKLKEEQILIDKRKLRQSDFPESILYEALKEYGFHFNDVNQIINGLDSQSGRQFYSKSHRLIDDRQFLIITKIKENVKEVEAFEIPNDVNEISQPIRLTIQHFSKPEDFIPEGDPNTAILDADKLQFPLIIRKWQRGDVFTPLGMRGRKLLSDFFTDLKLSIPQKERVFVLQSGDDIVWVLGYRIDDRHKILPKTKNIVRFTMHELTITE